MPLAQWFRPPRRTLTLFLCLMVILGAALGWLGWQVVERDRIVERSQVQDRLDLAADHVAAVLQRALADLDRLATAEPGPSSGNLPDDVVLLHATPRSMAVMPAGRLLFHPAIHGDEEPPVAIFAPGETLEFQGNDLRAASAVYKALAQSPRREVAAGALLRLGRTLRKSGQTEATLKVYDALAQLGSTSALGLPAELAASEARCSVLQAIGRTDDLKQDATRMEAALWSGRYIVLRAAWDFHREEARRWGSDHRPDERQQQALAISSAAEWVYARWSFEPASSGRRATQLEERPTLVSWTGTPERVDAVVAGPEYIRSIWTQALGGQPVQGDLVDADRHVAIGSVGRDGPKVVRTADATGLPWTLHVTGADPGTDSALFAGRRLQRDAPRVVRSMRGALAGLATEPGADTAAISPDVWQAWRARWDDLLAGIDTTKSGPTRVTRVRSVRAPMIMAEGKPTPVRRPRRA